jgi:uncharacterized membrane protein YbhN (UPF0104 family)
MNNLFVALILASVISVLSLFLVGKKDNNNFNQSTYLLKIFGISFLTIFVGLMFLIKGDSNIPEIEIGEADF